VSARLKSGFWVAAYLRRRNAQGVVAVLRRRGAEDAGTIYLKIDCLDGRARLFGPAPPSPDDEGHERRFALLLEADPLAVEDRVAREIGFDSDLWLIEVDDPDGNPQTD
jgi:hypothetical protein